ncbi:MAG: hypothetical protein Q7K35_05515 [bacterium]|nr:hypothetical protein [bacterium]
MVKCGIGLILHSYDAAEIELHFFLITKHRGKTTESDEMIPKLFNRSEIPYNKMWQNDRFTLPKFLSGRLCVALFTIDRDKSLAAAPKIKVVPVLPETIDWQSYEF